MSEDTDPQGDRRGQGPGARSGSSGGTGGQSGSDRGNPGPSGSGQGNGGPSSGQGTPGPSGSGEETPGASGSGRGNVRGQGNGAGRSSGDAGSGRGPSPGRGSLAAAAVGLLATLGLGLAAGGPWTAALAVGAGAGLAASVALVTAEGPLRVALGTLVGIPALAGVAAAPAAGPALGSLALVAAAFGAAATPLHSVGRGRYVEALGLLTVGLVPLGVTALASALWPVWGALAGAAADLVGGGGPATALLTASLLAALAAAALRAGVGSLPAAELAARDEREAVAAALATVEARLDAALRYALAGAALGVLAWILVALEVVPGVVELALSATVGLAPLRWLLFGAFALGVVVAVTARAVRWTGTTVLDRTRRGAAAGVGLALTVVVAAVADRLVFAAIDGAPDRFGEVVFGLSSTLGTVQTALLSATVVLLTVVFGSLVLPALAGIGLAPRRAFAPALSAGGLVGAAVATAGSVRPVATFGAVAAAMVVWDLGEHAVGVGEEVGDAAGTTPEAIHAGAGVWVGVVAVVFAWGLYRFLRATVAGGPAPLALAGLAAAVVGVLALVAALRG